MYRLKKTLHWFFLVHGNHACLVFSFKKLYAYGLFLHMDFPNLMHISVLEPIFNDTRTVLDFFTMQVWGPIPVWWCLFAYCDFENESIRGLIPNALSSDLWEQKRPERRENSKLIFLHMIKFLKKQKKNW